MELPLMDGTNQDIACSLGSDELRDRVAEWAALRRDTLLESRSEPVCLMAHYVDVDDVFDRLRRLVDEEGQCCPFLEFELRREAGVIVMELRYPPEAADLIDFVSQDVG